MGPQKPPKVVLFDVGGVLVRSELKPDLESFSLAESNCPGALPVSRHHRFRTQEQNSKGLGQLRNQMYVFLVSMFLVLDQALNLELCLGDLYI